MSAEHYHELLAAHSRSEHHATQPTKGGARSLSEVFGEDFTRRNGATGYLTLCQINVAYERRADVRTARLRLIPGGLS